MAIDKTTSDAMLGTFRNMLAESVDKGLSGTNLEAMQDVMQQMEKHAEEMDDPISFSTKLTTEDLFVKFSNAYSALLAEDAQKAYEGEDGYSDENLMKQSLGALEQALASYKDNPDRDKLAPPLEAVIALGKSGVSYPAFLRIQIEKGLDKAMEGSTVQRAGITKTLDYYKENMHPVEVKLNEELLATFDEMAATAPWGVPDSFVLGLHSEKTYWKYEPEKNEWYATIERWDRMLDQLHDWLDSFTKFAPYDERWVSMSGMAETKRNIKRTQECQPGFFKVREDVFFRYFNLRWDDIFTHKTYLNEMAAGRIWYSDACLELIKETYPHCKPFNKAPEDLIKRAEEMHDAKTFKRP